MVAVPAIPPVTTPAELTEPIAALLLDHVPLPETSDSVMESPWQTLSGPVIPAGNELTVIALVL